MTMIRQVSLLTAGAQPWNNNVCTAKGKRFAYAATQAIYIYEFHDEFNEFKLHSIMAEHNKPISAIEWHPTDLDVLASSNAENFILVWHVSKQKLLAVLETIRTSPTLLTWNPGETDVLTYIDGRGPLYAWTYSSTQTQPVAFRDWVPFTFMVTIVKWHPAQFGKVIFGHSNGSISIIREKVKMSRHNGIEVASNNDETNPVIAIEWDPLSNDYVLIVHKMTGIRMIDTAKMSVITVFQTPSSVTAIKTIGWLIDAPGMFVSGDSQTGVMRLWNVSRPTPLENFKLKHIGFHVLLPITSNFSMKIKGLPYSSSPLSITSVSVQMATPTLIVCLFMDGGIGVYNLGHRKWEFLKEMGHIETIFDCKFKPNNPDLFATGSFDGSIKVWNINTMKVEYSSVGNESIIYAVSWSPADLDCVAAATSKNGVVIWNMTKCSVTKRITDHGAEHCVYCVAWNQVDARRIASGAADLSCMVHYADGTLIQKYSHPGIVFGCDWKTDDADILATACLDGNIRIFNLNGKAPESILTGHTAKVFQVKWNLLRPEILCSSSDDSTVRVWEYISKNCLAVLHGHTNNVRGLAWHPEVPFLLFSGSWDKTIRAWDARDGACMDVVFDHGADVYGLSIHSAKPFVMISSSRDSTVRVWSTINLTPLLPLFVITQKSWHDIFAFTDRGYGLGAPALLCGRKSLELKAAVSKTEDLRFDSALELFGLFFGHSWGVTNLWDLIGVIKGKTISQLSNNYSKGIMYANHVSKVKLSEAQEIEMATTTRFGHGGLGLPSKEECLRSAANILLRVGQIKKYCEILVQLGEWEQALAIAPGVSYEFWKELATKRLDNLLTANSEKCLAYGMATGELAKMLEFAIVRRDLNDAYILAAAGNDGKIVRNEEASSAASKESYSFVSEDRRFLNEIVKVMSEWHFANGSPIHAACCCLTIDKIDEAILYLIRGHELELAVSAGLILKAKSEVVNTALQYLAKRCERLGCWDLAIKLLQMLPGNYETATWQTCARCSTSLAELDSLHKLANLPTRDRCLPRAQELINSGNVLQAVRYYIVSVELDTGLRLGMDYAKNLLRTTHWKVEEVWKVLQMLGSIKIERLQHDTNDMFLRELLVLSAYIGALMAIRRKYYPIVVPMWNHACTLYRDCSTCCVIPIDLKTMMRELDLWTSSCQTGEKEKEKDKTPTPSLDQTANKEKTSFEKTSSTHHEGNGDAKEGLVARAQSEEGSSNDMLSKLIERIGEEKETVDVGVTIMTGTHLPTHSDTHLCCLTGEIIKGPAYFLEDGHSAMSINDVLMWAKVNPFSPLGTGIRINPF